MARLIANLPENAAMPDLARQLVLEHACLMQADAACETTDGHRSYLSFRLAEAMDNLRDTENAVGSLSDDDLALLLQGLLDVHLRMTVEWAATVGDADPLRRAATASYPDTGDGSWTPAAADLLARQLVMARQSIGLDATLAACFGIVERELRREWTRMPRHTRLQVIHHLAYIAGCVATERCGKPPRGIFEFLQG
jgi:hypothetical protein